MRSADVSRPSPSNQPPPELLQHASFAATSIEAMMYMDHSRDYLDVEATGGREREQKREHADRGEEPTNPANKST